MMDAAGASFDSAIRAKEYDGGGMVTRLHFECESNPHLLTKRKCKMRDPMICKAK
jgi:hypothetical protein